MPRPPRRPPFALLSLLLAFGGCTGEGRSASDGAAASPTPATSATSVTSVSPATPEVSPRAPVDTSSPSPPAAASPASAPPVVVFLGDSLTAGLGLAAEQAYPALVESRLAAAGTPIRAVNAGVSGDTSAGGLRRLAWLLRQRPDVVVVELGANDALRGQPVAGIEANLREIVEQARDGGARVLLVGLRIPPNYGEDYAESFAAVFPRVADDLDVPLLPVLLEGVAGRAELNLADGIHPNATGHQRVAELMADHLQPLLREDRPAAAAAGR
jgi:acyl-CoA thioesterase I